MASIKFSRKEFEKHIKLNKEIEERISMFGTHLESLTNEEIEVEILPNRPDLFSFQGFLRSFKAFLGKNTGLTKYKIYPAEKDFRVKIDPSVKNVRPFTACAIVKNISFNDERIKEIIDIQEKLHSTLGRDRKKLAIGVYPLEKISLPIKFEARDPKNIKFIPLEMNVEMNGLQILQRHPTGREYAKLLQDYDKFPIFVDAKGKILSMPPIINSNETGKITLETKEVFIECSGFDFNILKKTLNIIVTALADMGGKVYSMELDYGKKEITPDLTPESMKINLGNVNKLLGLSLKEKDLEKLLPRMGYDYSSGKVKIPAWRADILHEVDIIEDVAIAYGYENIIPEIPRVATISEESKSSRMRRKIAEILVGLGLIEISSLHLIKPEEAKLGKIDRRELIELEDSKSEYKLLRPNLIIPALRILSENKDHEYPQKIFEIGTVFKKDTNENNETGVMETDKLLIASTPSNFTELKQGLDYLSRRLDIKITIQEATKPQLIEGRTASIFLNDREIGYIGEVHPETLRSWNIKMPIAVLEISLEDIFNQIKS